MKRNPQDFLVKPSTRQFVRAARGAAHYSLYDFLHGYIYARWLYLYIGIGTGEHPLAKKFGPLVTGLTRLKRRGSNGKQQGVSIESGAEFETERKTFAETYHGKVVPLDAAKQLVTVGEDIDLPNLEQIIPYKQARDIILRNPDHIVALECPCRSSRAEPCLPLDVCLVVGEPFASFVIEHHPERSHWISSFEAVDILQAEHDRGHVSHAFFKDAMLGRFYAICNCCSCCCGAMQAQRNGTPMLASSGYVSQVDDELCIGCGECAEFCQFEALSIPNGTASVDVSLCMGCGVCVDKCVEGALSLGLEPTKGEPLEIQVLMDKIEFETFEGDLELI